MTSHFTRRTVQWTGRIQSGARNINRPHVFQDLFGKSLVPGSSQHQSVSPSSSFSTEHPGIPTTSTPMNHLIFGANTDVGKTVLTAGLIRACRNKNGSSSSRCQAHYIKPLQCGGSDEGFVNRNVPDGMTSTHTLFEWQTPASPHHAARLEDLPVSDGQVLSALSNCLDVTIPAIHTSNDSSPHDIWVETAGGVLSPSSSSPQNHESAHASNDAGWGWSTQGDLYMAMRDQFDVVLIGDGRLGGISATLSSLESLLSRGYNVSGLLFIETGYDNQKAIQEYASRNVSPPFQSKAALFDDPQKSIVSLPALPPEPEPLTEWYDSAEVSENLDAFVNGHLRATWFQRHS